MIWSVAIDFGNWAIQSNEKKKIYIHLFLTQIFIESCRNAQRVWLENCGVRNQVWLSSVNVICFLSHAVRVHMMDGWWYMHRKFQSLPLHCNVSRYKMCVQCVSRSQWFKKNCPYPKTIRWCWQILCSHKSSIFPIDIIEGARLNV